MRLLEKLNDFWRIPEVLQQIKEFVMTAAQNTEQLVAKVNSLGEAISKVAVVLGETRAKVAEQARLLEEAKNSGADPAVLAAMNASIDASLDQLGKLVAEPVNDPEVPTGDVEAPPATNPETEAPVDVPVPDAAPEIVTEPSEVTEPAAETPVREGVDGAAEGPSA